jgi:hypothetical protein
VLIDLTPNRTDLESICAESGCDCVLWSVMFATYLVTHACINAMVSANNIVRRYKCSSVVKSGTHGTDAHVALVASSKRFARSKAIGVRSKRNARTTRIAVKKQSRAYNPNMVRHTVEHTVHNHVGRS